MSSFYVLGGCLLVCSSSDCAFFSAESVALVFVFPQFWGALPTEFSLHGLVFATRNYDVFASDFRLAESH